MALDETQFGKALWSVLEDAGCESMLEVEENNGSPGIICTCPFHDDTSPSFAANCETGLWVCYGCDEKGNFPMLVNKLFGIPISEAIQKYARLTGWPELPDRHVDTHEPYDVLPEQVLINYKKYCPRYMLDRGFSKRFLRDFEIGYDTMEHRVVFPIRNVKSELVGLTTRATLPGDKPKYKHSRFQKSEHIYLLHRIQQSQLRNGAVVIVEGHADGLRAWQRFGQGALSDERAKWPLKGSFHFAGAGALMGAHISKDQAKLLALHGVECVVWALDNDDAGEKGLETGVKALLAVGIRSQYRMSFPGKDLGELEPKADLEIEEL